MTEQEFLKIIDKYNYVSFDLFDTLIFRSVKNPYNVFELVEIRYNAGNPYHRVFGFKQIRILAEKIARKRNKEVETKLDDIYLYLPYKKEVRDDLKKLEMQTEIDVSVPNTIMIDILKQCKIKGKNVLITTDMYLPEEAIVEILKKNQIPYDHLFLSCSIGVTKARGSLFPYILHELNIFSKDIIHIGDNLMSDIAMPHKYGIASEIRLTIPEYQTNHMASGKKKVLADHINIFIQKKLSTKGDISTAYEIGYSVLGPLVYQTCIYINKYVNEIGADKIIFVAREGYFIEQVYKAIFIDDNYKCDYLRINKNVLRMPILYLYPSVEKFLSTIPSKHQYTWESLTNYFPNKIKCDIKDNCIISKQELLNGKYNNEFEELLYCNRKEIKKQYELLKKYLKNSILNHRKVVLVNNSINGNGQIMLDSILKKDNYQISLYGFQFTKSPKCKSVLKDRVYACITDGKMPKAYTAMFDYCTLLFEHLLFEQKGTSLLFEDTIPVDVKCDLIGEESSNENTINEIQKAAFDFVIDYKLSGIPMDESVFYMFFDMYLNPSENESKLLGSIIAREADMTDNLINSMKWVQANEALKGNSVNNLNKKFYIKCFIKSILLQLNIFKY